MNSQQRYNYWKQNCLDEQLKAQLDDMEGDAERIENAFYKDMVFGTAGIRGIIGAGTNCLNIYTIARITKGIADYMNDSNLTSVSICRDCRNYSDEFTLVAARVFAENGIKVYITHDIMPTPFLSYMVRSCPSDMGVMITASHNPPSYNGYKVYNRHGYQLTDSDALSIAGYIDKVEPFGIVYRAAKDYIDSGMIEYIDDELVNKYLLDVQSLSLNPLEGIKVVYSPLNGTGYKLVPQILNMCGIEHLKIVAEQGYPDGNFPTCKSPNPEKRDALEYGIRLARENDYDIVLATDPDADRIAVAVRQGEQFILLTGNETGVLLTDYLFDQMTQKGCLPNNPIVIKSIVTTPMAAEIAKSYGGQCVDVLTGFKYIGELITLLESKNEGNRFVLGFEESYGYLVGTHAKDKDAVVAAMLISEMAALYKKQGMTLYHKLITLYQKFGTYEHKLISYEYPGAAGNKKMQELLSSFRTNPPKILAGSDVISKVDYLRDDTGLPKADVIKLDSAAGSRLIVRPSGTEPLIKFYISASKTPSENQVQIQDVSAQVEKWFKV